jgi:RNA polymerase sigma-70 factor (ECF subfamily)
VAGDAAAFAALYDRHIDRVYRHCYFRIGNRADSEDLAQQTFLHAWRAIGRYRRGSTPFIAWLLTISQHLAMSHFRKTRPVAPLEGDEPWAREPTADPEDELASAVMRDSVRAAILRLKAERQQVIILRFIEDFSTAEIAAALGKSENNIRVLQHRALGDLRRLLNEPEAEYAPDDATLIARMREAIELAIGKLASSQPPA